MAITVDKYGRRDDTHGVGDETTECRWATAVTAGRFSGFWIAAFHCGLMHRKRLPHSDDEGISGRADGLAFDLVFAANAPHNDAARRDICSPQGEERRESLQLHESARLHDSHEKKSLQEDQQ